MSLRTPLNDWKYKRLLKRGGSVPLNELPPLKEWNNWILVTPISPHDKHHTEHLMLVLKRPCGSPYEMYHYELAELFYTVIRSMDETNHYIKFNLKKMRSINGYVHLHVLDLKEKYQ